MDGELRIKLSDYERLKQLGSEKINELNEEIDRLKEIYNEAIVEGKAVQLAYSFNYRISNNILKKHFSEGMSIQEIIDEMEHLKNCLSIFVAGSDSIKELVENIIDNHFEYLSMLVHEEVYNYKKLKSTRWVRIGKMLGIVE